MIEAAIRQSVPTSRTAASFWLCSGMMLLPLIAGLLFFPPPSLPGGRMAAFHQSAPVVVWELIFLLISRQSASAAFHRLPGALRAAALVWLAAMAVSFLKMNFPLFGAVKTFVWLVHALFALHVAAFLAEHPATRRTLAYAFAAGGLAYLLFLTIIVATTPQPYGRWAESMPGFLNVRHLGFYLGALAAISMRGVIDPERKHGIFWRAAALIFTAALCWTGGRASVLALVAATALVILSLPRVRSLRAGAEAVAVVAAGALLAQVHQLPDTAFDLLRLVPNESAAGADLNSYSSNRIAMWSETLDLIAASPFVGYGAGQAMSLLDTAGGYFAQPHNFVLQFMLAWGIPGGLAAMALLTYPFVFLWQRRADLGAAEGAFLIGALALVGTALLDASLYHPWPIAMLVLLAGCAYPAANRAP